MDKLKDIDETIVQDGKELLHFVHKYGEADDVRVRCLADIPCLLLCAFGLLTADSIKDHPFRTLGEKARTLQEIIDTLEQTLKLPMGHFSGNGLATLDRRQLSDILQIFIDIMKHCYPEPDNNTEPHVEATPEVEGRRLTLSQLESPDLGQIVFNMTSTPDMPFQTVRKRPPSVATVTPKLAAPNKVVKPPGVFKGRLSTKRDSGKDTRPKYVPYEKPPVPETSLSRPRSANRVQSKAGNQRSGSTDRVKIGTQRTGSVDQFKVKVQRNGSTDRIKGLTQRTGSNDRTKERNKGTPTINQNRPRRPSVLSTKAKRRSSVTSPTLMSHDSISGRPVRRGKISSKTNSLCSSIKLLEEFDYINRRLREIKQQKERLNDLIKDLEEEETRLEYVVSHIHRQAGKSMEQVCAQK